MQTSIQIAEDIRKTIEQEPVEFEDKMIKVTASIGISNLKNEHDNYSAIFAEADEALYSAKELGRNRVQFFKQ